MVFTVSTPRTLMESDGMTVDGAGKEGLGRGGSDRQPPWTPEELSLWLFPPFPGRSLEVEAAVIDKNVSTDE